VIKCADGHVTAARSERRSERARGANRGPACPTMRPFILPRLCTHLVPGRHDASGMVIINNHTRPPSHRISTCEAVRDKRLAGLQCHTCVRPRCPPLRALALQILWPDLQSSPPDRSCKSIQDPRPKCNQHGHHGTCAQLRSPLIDTTQYAPCGAAPCVRFFSAERATKTHSRSSLPRNCA